MLTLPQVFCSFQQHHHLVLPDRLRCLLQEQPLQPCFFLPSQPSIRRFPIHMNFFLKGYEFVIGMMIGYYHEKFNPKWIFLSLPVVIFFVLCPFALPISTGLKITILAVAFWISAACLEPVLEKGNGRFLRTISNYSYEVFLVHHIIIYFITPRAIPYMRGMVGVLGLFLVELLLMAVLGFLLKSISDQCIAALTNLTAVENKR